MNERSEPRYIISIAAKMVGVETHTLRYYERVGVLEPSRSRGRIRLYSERDIELLKRVKMLVEELGINLAGVEVILRMSEKMLDLQREVSALSSEVKRLREEEK